MKRRLASSLPPTRSSSFSANTTSWLSPYICIELPSANRFPTTSHCRRLWLIPITDVASSGMVHGRSTSTSEFVASTTHRACPRPLPFNTKTKCPPGSQFQRLGGFANVSRVPSDVATAP